MILTRSGLQHGCRKWGVATRKDFCFMRKGQSVLAGRHPYEVGAGIKAQLKEYFASDGTLILTNRIPMPTQK
jgi:hypothetical protein